MWNEEGIQVSQESFAEEADVKLYNSPFQQIYMQSTDASLRMRTIDSAVKVPFLPHIVS